MTILKLNKVSTSETKSYKVVDGVLYIDDEALEFDSTDDTISSWASPSEGDIPSIERDDDDNIVISLNVFTDKATLNSFFSVVLKPTTGLVEDATFPYQTIDGTVVWYNDIIKFNGLEW